MIPFDRRCYGSWNIMMGCDWEDDCHDRYQSSSEEILAANESRPYEIMFLFSC
jgi:hypothetical protein